MSTMKAAVLESPRGFVLRDVARPRPRAGQVAIEIEGCGICGSNLAPWRGASWFKYPFSPGAPGHEGWGRVCEAGEGAPESLIGKRVAFLSEQSFAEVDLADAECLVEIPAALDGRPVPGEAFACAANVVRRAAVKPEEKVAVVGIGFLGSVITAMLAERGVAVTAISRRRFALDLARVQGAARCEEFTQETASSLGQEQFGCVIECTGEQEALDLATSLVSVRGRIVIAGYHQGGPRTIDMQQWNWKGIDVVNAHERDRNEYVRGMRHGMEWLAGAAARGSAGFVTTELPLRRLNEGMRLLGDRPDGFLKGVVLL